MTDVAERTVVPETRPKSKTLLELRGLTVEYGLARAVDGIDLQIGEREIVGLAGESGCG